MTRLDRLWWAQCMEVGLGYTSMWSRFRRRLSSLPALILMAVGLVLIAGGASYFIYSWRAHSNLDSLNVAAVGDDDITASSGLITQRQSPGTGTLTEADSNDLGASLRLSPEAIAAQVLYPGEVLNPVLWSNPLAGEAILGIPVPLLEEFQTVDLASVPPPKSLPAPTRITIPAIGVDSDVMSLQLLNLGDSRAYETPKNVVGHIPTTANAGELGTVWLFGHLESPIRGEGSVFSELPEIPRLLRQGVDVYVTLENGESTFLYRLVSSEVVHQDDLTLHEMGGASISLVTCVPRLVYDYRLVVAGELVGVKRS